MKKQSNKTVNRSITSSSIKSPSPKEEGRNEGKFNAETFGTIITLKVMLFSSLLLTGCMTGKDGHTYIDGHCVTCLNSPVTGEAYNYSKNSPNDAQAKTYRQAPYGQLITETSENAPYLEGFTSLSVRMDIDTVYTRIKREFGFLTRAEWERSYLYDDGGILWEGIPGVSYQMRFTVPHRFKGVTRNHYIETTLVKNRRNTDITFKFWVQISNASLKQYAYSINKRAASVLR